MKKIFAAILLVIMTLSLAACSGGNSSGETSQTTNTDTTSEPELSDETTDETTNKTADEAVKNLVVYFSMPDDEMDDSTVNINGETLGNTQYMANVIQQNTNADIFRIVPKTAYPTNHEELIDLAKDEQNNNARPEIESIIENFDDYDTVFVGYPNWWGDMPMILYTFFDTYDFSGKTIIPFNTHGGSGFSGTVDTIKELEPNADIRDGLSISRDDIQNAEQDIIDWLKELGFKKVSETTIAESTTSETVITESKTSVSNTTNENIANSLAETTINNIQENSSDANLDNYDTPEDDSKTEEPVDTTVNNTEYNSTAPPSVQSELPPQTEPVADTPHILVAYFSRTGENYGVGVIEKGNTHIIADMIAEETGADIFEIARVTPYPENYRECTDEAQAEKNAGARPELTAVVDNFDDYDVIFLGYPNWWGDMPMPVYTFIESYDFSGKTVIPFCTHAGSGLSGTVRTLQNSLSNASVLDGFAIAGTTAQNSQDEAKEAVIEWLDEIEY